MPSAALAVERGSSGKQKLSPWCGKHKAVSSNPGAATYAVMLLTAPGGVVPERKGT